MYVVSNLYGCVCAQLLSRVRFFATPRTAASQASLSIVILQARLLERAAMPSSRGSSQTRDWTQVSCIAGGFFTVWATREAQALYKRSEVDCKNTCPFHYPV